MKSLSLIMLKTALLRSSGCLVSYASGLKTCGCWWVWDCHVVVHESDKVRERQRERETDRVRKRGRERQRDSERVRVRVRMRARVGVRMRLRD